MNHSSKTCKYLFVIAFLLCLGLSSRVIFAQEDAASPADPAVPATLISETGKIVTAIEVKGNKTISLATVLSKIKTRVGQDYIQSVISEDLKRLYNTGYFSDVRVDREDFESGFKVIIYLEEKSIVEEITFSKTRHIKTKKISKELKSQVGKFFDSKALQDDIKFIKDQYAQKGLTTAEVDVEKHVDDVTNKVSLHFVIKEGEKIRIRRINIVGNDTFRDGKIFKVIKSRTKNLFRSGILKEEVLEEDMERVTSFYEQEGFIDATVDYTSDYLSKGYVNIEIQINEGKRYFVGDLTISGNKILSLKEINAVIKEVKPGAHFSRERLTVDISNIRTLYFDNGYIFANVVESAAINQESGQVDVSINIEEGSLAYVDRVKVQGNVRTRDIVIRRELRVFPGDRFDGAKLRRSKERLSNLGYFEDVAFDIEDTEVYDRKNLVVQVKEAKTGTFSFGGGFSTVDRLVGFVEVEQRNFDFTNWPSFTGGGQRISLRAEAGASRSNFLLSFTEPWLFDHPVSAGFDAYITNREREENTGYAYDEDRQGGQIRLGKQFTEYWSGRSNYKFETVEIGNFETGVSADLLAEEGKNSVSLIGTGIGFDNRDSTINPTKGLNWDSGVDVAGTFLGGDKDFYRFETGVGYYIPLKWESVVEFRLRTGIVNEYGDSDRVPIFERFFAGGSRTIRGYDERGVGPLDSVTNDPIGGEAMLVGNIEYTIPVIEFIKLAAFFDMGNVWPQVDDYLTDELLYGTGLGLRIKTPIGPINLDYGYPLSDEPGEDGRSGKFYFSVSRGF